MNILNIVTLTLRGQRFPEAHMSKGHWPVGIVDSIEYVFSIAVVL